MKSKLSAALAAVGAVAGMGRLRHLPIRQPWEYRMMRKSHFVLVALLLASTAANAASLNFQISEDNGAPTQFLNVPSVFSVTNVQVGDFLIANISAVTNPTLPIIPIPPVESLGGLQSGTIGVSSTTGASHTLHIWVTATDLPHIGANQDKFLQSAFDQVG